MKTNSFKGKYFSTKMDNTVSVDCGKELLKILLSESCQRNPDEKIRIALVRKNKGLQIKMFYEGPFTDIVRELTDFFFENPDKTYAMIIYNVNKTSFKLLDEFKDIFNKMVVSSKLEMLVQDFLKIYS